MENKNKYFVPEVFDKYVGDLAKNADHDMDTKKELEDVRHAINSILWFIHNIEFANLRTSIANRGMSVREIIATCEYQQLQTMNATASAQLRLLDMMARHRGVESFILCDKKNSVQVELCCKEIADYLFSYLYNL